MALPLGSLSEPGRRRRTRAGRGEARRLRAPSPVGQPGPRWAAGAAAARRPAVQEGSAYRGECPGERGPSAGCGLGDGLVLQIPPVSRFSL